MLSVVEEAEHLVLPCSVAAPGQKQTSKLYALVDTGATSYFIDDRVVKRLKLPKYKLPEVRTMKLADPTKSSTLTHYTTIEMAIGSHYEKVTLYVVPSLDSHIVLGTPWLKAHHICPDLNENTVTFQKKYCGHRSCLPCREDVTVKGTAIQRIPQQDRIIHSVDINNIRCETVSIEEFCDTINEGDGETIIIWPEEYSADDEDAQPQLSCAKLATADFQKFMAKKDILDPKMKLPEYLHKWAKVFSKPSADKLPPHRPEDHEIKLHPDAKLPFKRAYGMTRDELEATKKYVDEHLVKNFIRTSKSPVASPVILVKKPGGGLRFCVDYRALNAITIKNRYPIPQIRETLDRLCKAKFYTKLDIIAAFNNLRVKEGDEWKTAFTTRYGQFEYLVMPFGLCNAPSSFQSYINTALQDILDQFCTAYLDDVLIFSETLEDHHQHVEMVLERLDKAGLFVDIDKCEFDQQEVKYLGMFIGVDGLKMDPAKIKTIMEWPTPRTIKEVLSFLGFANFYRRFIEKFSKLALPLTELTKTKEKDGKKALFKWDEKCQKAFNMLKRKFASYPIIQHFNPDKPTTVEVDSSDFVVGGILSQKDDSDVLRPVAYFSKKMSPQECNYEIYDKELLAIVRAFEEWRPELATTDPKEVVQVLSDHRSLEYFMTTKELNRRQARWSEFLSQFQFKITYRPGTQGTKPDALTRMQDAKPDSEDDPRKRHQRQVLLKQHNLDEGVLPPQTSLNAVRLAKLLIEAPTFDLHAQIDVAAKDDELMQEIFDCLKQGKQRLSPSTIKAWHISLSDCYLDQERLHYKKRLWVPADDHLRLTLIEAHHAGISAGHPGRERTLELISREYYWPRLAADVIRYVQNCQICHRVKAFRETFRGGLQQLRVPKAPWQDIAVDFVVELPASKVNNTRYTNILTVTDRLTKYRYFILADSMTAEETAILFYTHVWSRHGVPVTVVSDRGTQFVSQFMKRLYQRLQIQPKLSTAFHPQTDGQSENTNQTMETYLRAYVNHLQDDWATWLPAAQFAINNHTSETTKVTPFFALYGTNPRMGIEPPKALPTATGKQLLDIKSADEFANKMESLHTHLREQMTFSQARYEEQANKGRHPSPNYKVGDLVYVDARNMSTNRPTKKLDYKNLGPFAITKQCSPQAYRLDLPREMKMHNVFNTLLLRPAAKDPLPGQAAKEPPKPEVVITDGVEQEQWTAIGIKDTKLKGRGKKLHYLVDWKGYEHATWQPWEDVLPGCDRIVKTFHERRPDRPAKPADYEYVLDDKDNDSDKED